MKEKIIKELTEKIKNVSASELDSEHKSCIISMLVELIEFVNEQEETIVTKYIEYQPYKWSQDLVCY